MLPICQIRLRAKKPLSEDYPKGLKTVGDHIRMRRLDLNLRQKDVAMILGVSQCSVWNWENHMSNPTNRLVHRIIKFLGYVPADIFSESL